MSTSIPTETLKIGKKLKHKKIKKSIDLSYRRIIKFHSLQKSKNIRYVDNFKNKIEYKYFPISSVGVYVPGSKVSYPSTLLMNVIPALVAGVKRIVLINPAYKGKQDSAVLYAARKCKINEIYSGYLVEGLNYITWRLDEASESLNQRKGNNKSRGIAVLPGMYKIVLEYKSQKDSVVIKIKQDPRFDISDEIEKQRYLFKKSSKKIVKQLNDVFRKIDKVSDSLNVMEEKIDYKNKIEGYGELFNN